MTVQLPEVRYSDAGRRRAFFQEALGKIEELPGVRGAAVGSVQFGSFNGNAPNENIVVDGRPFTLNVERHERQIVSEDYFRVAGIPLRQGRLLRPEDANNGPHVAVINETMARRFWPFENPIGKRFKEVLPGTDGPWSKVGMTVVGVVGDVSYSRDGSVAPVFYRSIRQWSLTEISLIVRTEKDPLNLVAAVRGAVQSVDLTVPYFDITTVEQQLDELDRPRRFQTELIGLFAILALILAALGLYGLMSTSVQQRTKEIGIRVALGATSGHVVRLILRQALKWAFVGVAIGVGGALAFGKALSALLFGITATDPITLTLVIVVLAAVMALASALPAATQQRSIRPSLCGMSRDRNPRFLT